MFSCAPSLSRSRSFSAGGGLLRRGLGYGFEYAGSLTLFRGLEHDVRFEKLPDMGLELESRQLQETNGLLQLRCHGQLLT